ncbi:MAG TPA: hypothetical protein VNL35_13655 [Chloroflexota bacterium]|nr:hypothetical protein [Chloroflexota bacterium]
MRWSAVGGRYADLFLGLIGSTSYPTQIMALLGAAPRATQPGALPAAAGL